MGAWRRRIPQLMAVIAAVLLLPNAALAEPAGVRFLDESAIAVSRKQGEASPFTLVLLNGTGQATSITLYLVAATRDDDAVFPVSPAPGPDGRLATSPRIEVGGRWRTEISLGSDAAAPSVYAAQLVALGSDGSVARRDLTLTIEPSLPVSPTPIPSPNSGLFLVEPLPSITLTTERSSLPWDDSSPANVVTIAADPELFDRLIPGALASEYGDLATVTVHADGRIVVVGAGPGVYKGILGRPKEGTEIAPAKFTDVTLNVRDGVAWPIVVLLTGLALAAFIEWAATDHLPKGALGVRLSELERRAKTAAANHKAQMTAAGAAWLGDDVQPFRIDGFDNEGRPAVLTAGIATAMGDFDDTPSGDKRAEKWGTRGSEFGALRSLVESFEKSIAQRQETQVTFPSMRENIPEGLRPRLDSSGLRLAIAVALSGRVPLSIDEWNGVKENIAAVHNAVLRGNKLVNFLAALDRLIPKDSPDQRTIDQLWVRLSVLDIGPLGELDQLEKDAIALRNKVVQAAFDTSDDVALGRARLQFFLFRGTAMAEAFEPTFSQMLSSIRLERVATEPQPPVAPILRTPEEIRSALRNWNWAFLAVVIASVVVVGLSTQYATKANFGSPNDYIILLAWGFVGTAALQLVKNFVAGAGFLRR